MHHSWESSAVEIHKTKSTLTHLCSSVLLDSGLEPESWGFNTSQSQVVIVYILADVWALWSQDRWPFRLHVRAVWPLHLTECHWPLPLHLTDCWCGNYPESQAWRVNVCIGSCYANDDAQKTPVSVCLQLECCKSDFIKTTFFEIPFFHMVRNAYKSQGFWMQLRRSTIRDYADASIWFNIHL